MHNNTLTASETYLLFSYEDNFEEKRKKQPTESIKLEEENVLEFGYLYSVVLKRAEVSKVLSSCFTFENSTDVIDFLAINMDVLQLLPNIVDYIKRKFDSDAILSLELMSEDSDWQTLFINIQSKVSWKKADRFINKFLDKLFENYPQIAEKLNINIVPNEF